MSDFDLDHVPKKLIMVTVCVIVLAAFAIPTILEFAYGPGPHPGDEQDYYATANLPDAAFSFSGSAMEYATVEGNHVHFVWDDSGTFELIVTATTHQPDQTAVKTISYDVKGDWQYTALLLVIPTLMIVAVMMYVIRPIRENIRTNRGGGNGGDGDISGGVQRSPHNPGA